MNTVAIIQARTGSSRLPGKVLRTLVDQSVLAHVWTRARAASPPMRVVIATTDHPSDDAIVREAENLGADWFRGSEQNVLERYYQAAKHFGAEVVVRITSDCPLLDPAVLAAMLDRFTSLRAADTADYLSNTLVRSYPRGLDAEIFTFEALERTYANANKPYEREHVTPYIYQHPEEFRIEQWVNEKDLSAYRLTLDTEEDYQLISTIYSNLYRPGHIFLTAEILDLMQQWPELARINAHVVQKGLEG